MHACYPWYDPSTPDVTGVNSHGQAERQATFSWSNGHSEPKMGALYRSCSNARHCLHTVHIRAKRWQPCASNSQTGKPIDNQQVSTAVQTVGIAPRLFLEFMGHVEVPCYELIDVLCLHYFPFFVRSVIALTVVFCERRISMDFITVLCVYWEKSRIRDSKWRSHWLSGLVSGESQVVALPVLWEYPRIAFLLVLLNNV